MKNSKKTWVTMFVTGFLASTVASLSFKYFNNLKSVDKESAKIESPAQMEESFNMTFTKNDGIPLENNSIPPAIVDGKAKASNLTVSEDETTIEPFKIKLYKLGDGAIYSFEAHNDGDKTAYLESVKISTSYLNSDMDFRKPDGLRYALDITADDGHIEILSENGEAIPKFTPTGETGSNFISVPPGGKVYFTLHIDAEPDAPFYSAAKTSAGSEFTLGAISVVWN